MSAAPVNCGWGNGEQIESDNDALTLLLLRIIDTPAIVRAALIFLLCVLVLGTTSVARFIARARVAA